MSVRLPWLENMVKEGSVRATVRDKIYKDCNTTLSKVADDTGSSLLSLGLMASAPLISAAMGKLSVGSSQKAMLSNRNDLIKDETFSGNREAAVKRFDEIANIAPSVAANKILVFNLVKKTLGRNLSFNDVASLASVQSTTMSKSLNPLSDQKSMTSHYNKVLAKHASANRLGNMYADVLLLAKKANISNRKRIIEGLKTTALISSIPLLAGLGSGIVQHLSAKASKEEMEERLNDSFNKALSMNPDDTLHSDKDRARKAFKTLVHFAPHVAAEPSAARAFMNKLVSYDMGIDSSSVKELTEIERNISQSSKPTGFLGGFRSGADATGLQHIVSSGIGRAISPTQDMIGRSIVHDIDPTFGQKV